MDVKRGNIVMVIPNLGMGGAQRSFSKLANWLSEDYNVTIAVFDNSFELSYPVEAKIQYLGEASPSGLIGKTSNFQKRIKALRRIKKELKPIASISFLEGADYLNVLSGIGERKIISIRGSKKHDPHVKGVAGTIRRRILIPWLYKKADKIVTASLGLEKEISEDYPILKRNLTTIPNGYDLSKAEPRTSNKTCFVLGWAGRFGDEKGLLEFVEVFKRCHDLDNSFRLLLIGKGPLQDTVESNFSVAGLRVSVKSNAEESDFSVFDVIICDPGRNYERMLGLSNLFLLTSPSEGFPNVLIEAMMMEIPVVSTDCQWGPREILAKGIEYSERLSYPYFAEFGILLPVLSKDRRAQQAWIDLLSAIKIDPNRLSKYRQNSQAALQPYDQSIVKRKWLQMIGE